MGSNEQTIKEALAALRVRALKRQEKRDSTNEPSQAYLDFLAEQCNDLSFYTYEAILEQK